MQFDVREGEVATEPADVALLLCAGSDGVPEHLVDSFEADDFAGDLNQTVVAYPRNDGGAKRAVLVGLGAADTVNAESIRQAAATAIREARRFRPAVVTVAIAGLDIAGLGAEIVGEALAIGLPLGAYRFVQHRTGLSEAEQFEFDGITILGAPQDVAGLAAGVEIGQAIAGGVLFARDLVNTPPEFKTPPLLAERAIELGERATGITVTVFDDVELAEQGFGGVLAVGKASDSKPRFMILEYGAEYADAPTVCVVGKGITFDSGGVNIKPEEGMLNMKNDMGGSAAVFGVLQVVSELALPVHVVGLVPSAENMISGNSYRPGDVITTLSGKTVEILNTDAEGRVILSDALFYAQRYEPDAIVELSTLTGAVIVALGNVATGVMATDQPLADLILAAAEQSGDRAWQLPLWQDYHDMIKGDVGDIKNLGGRPAGSITAGAFLAAFVGDFPFVHLDIAGTAWLDKPTKPYQSKGGTGAGVRLVVDYLRTLVAAP